MIPELDAITFWLGETYIHGTVVLVMALAALALIKQPARRMPVAWGAMVGLVALAILPAMSWWPRIAMPVWQIAVPAQTQAHRGKLAADTSGPASADGPESQVGDAQLSLAEDMPADLADSPRTAFEAIGMASPLDDGPASLNQLRGTEHTSGDTSPTALSPDVAVATGEFPVVPRNWRIRATWLWLIGALLTAIWIACGAWRTERLVRRSQAAPGWVRDELRGIVPSHRREPTTRISRLVASALVCGAMRPAILLREPQAEPDERRGIRAALAHEYAHIAHGDLWLLVLERLLLPVYFGHPLFWLLRRWIRTDQELLADAAAAGQAPVDYAEALLAWAKSSPAAHATGFSAALPLWNSPCHLKRRIEMLLDVRNPIARHASRLWRGAVLTAITALVICVSLVTLQPAPSIAQARPDRSAEEQSGSAAATDAAVAPAISNLVVSDAEKPADSDSVPTNLTAKPNHADMRADKAMRADDADGPAVRKTFLVQLNIVMMQVDHAELARLGTSLSKLAADRCVFINESRTKDNIIGVHTSTECSHKLVEALKLRRAAKLERAWQIDGAIESGPKSYPSPAEGQADDGMDLKQDFKHAKSSLHLAAKLVNPTGAGIMYVKLNISGDQTRKLVDSKTGGGLEITSARKIGYAAFVKVGQSLFIVNDSADSESDPQADRVSLIVVSPVKIERMPDSEPQPGNSRELDALRKVVEELKQEIRELRDQSKKQPPAVDARSDGAATGNSKSEERQITLRARFVEVPASNLKEICALSSTGDKKFVAEIAPGAEGTVTGILDAVDATVLNNLLDADKQAKVVFDSRVTMRSGHTARFLPKGETAVLTLGGKDASSSGSISFHGAGATLMVLATVQERDLFRLQIVPEFSAIDASKTVDGIPAVNTRRVQATVELREGQTVALLSSQLSADSNIRVLIFLTAEIARSANSTAAPNPADRDAPNLSPEPPAIEPKASSHLPVTQPANTDAPKSSDDAFWHNLRLERRLTSPPLTASPSVGELLPSADEKPDAELEAILAKWAAAASQIQRLQCTFTRFNYDNRHLTESRADGVIVVDAPDRAFYNLGPTNVYRLKSHKLKPDGTPYDLRTEPRERAWLWTGRSVLHLDMRGKTYTAAPLTAGDQPPSDADLFFLARPFLLGMPAPELLQHFAVSFKKSEKEQVWLSFVPRRPQAPYREAILLLSRSDWRVRALKLVDPTGEIESVHVFEKFALPSPVSDSQKKHLLDLAEMNIPGFRAIMQQRNFPQPGNVPPGTDAVFLARQGLLRAEQLGLSTVPATVGEFPAGVSKRFRGGMKVTAVVKGGLAETGGIRPDDILVGLHHWEICRKEDLDYAVRQLATMELGTDSSNTGGVSAILIRNGEVLKTTIKLQ